MSPPRIAIFGSCVTRDLLEGPLRPALAQYTSRSSIISAVADPVPLDPDEVALDSPFQKRCVLEDFGKSFFTQLAESRPDWLVVDLIDERFEVLRTEASCVTRSSAFVSAGLDATVGTGLPRVKRLTPEAETMLDEALATFAGRVREVLGPERVIVHRAGWLTGYRRGDELHAFPDDRAAFAERHNAALDRAYDTLESCLDGRAPVVALDRDAYRADAEHKWELEPFHYEAAYNEAAVDRLRRYTGA